MPVSKKKSPFIIIWFILAVISFIILVSLVFAHINEMIAVKLGHRIEAEYYEEGGGIYARYYDEDEKFYTYNLTSYYPIHDNDRVTLYYTTRIDEAEPANTLVSWLKFYAFFGCIFGVSMWRINKVTGTIK